LISFAIAFLVILLALYVPGFLFFQSLRFSPVLALASAPLFSVCCYSMLPIVFEKTGVASSAVTLLAPTIVLAGACFVVSRKRSKEHPAIGLTKAEPIKAFSRSIPFNWAAFFGYVLIGSLVTVYVYLSSIGSPSGFFCRFDNLTHLNLVQSFLDTGNWSSLGASVYQNLPPSSRAVESAGFYPSAWHDIVALACSAAGTPITVASNALNAITTGIILPSGAFVFVSALFPRKRKIIGAGAFIAMAFAALPWPLMLKGPLYSNLLAFSMLPVFLGCFMLLLNRWGERKSPGVLALTCLVSGAALALAQTNALFAAYVFLGAFMVHFVYSSVSRMTAPHSAKSLGAAFGALALLILIWLAMLQAPFLQAVINTQDASQGGKLIMALRVLSLHVSAASQGASEPQPLVALIALIGFIACIRKRSIWLLFPSVYMAAAYYLARITTDPINHAISGFWYSDPYRLAAAMCLFLVPVASYGLASIISLVQRLHSKLKRERESERADNGAGLAVPLVTTCAISLVIFCPNFVNPINGTTVETPFGSLADRFSFSYSPYRERVLDAREAEFLQSVKETIPEGALIINQPNDGSAFTYGTDHLNVYYRHISIKGLTDDANLIRTAASSYVTNEEVANALRKVGAEYVLLLDQGVAYEDGIWLPQYRDPNQWAGIDTITDSTPGFSVVLEDGDMRLYHIDSL